MTGRGYLVVSLAMLVALPAAASPPAGFSEQSVVTGLVDPTKVAFSPLDNSIWVTEQGGKILIKRPAQALKQIIDLVVSPGCERGLLGLAFDPAFTTNHFLYVYYTHPGPPVRNRVSRFTEAADVLSNETPIIDDLFVSSACNHNGGVLQFGADGKLYVGIGDNANSSNSPDLTTPLGKVLRVSTDGTPAAGNPFSVPNDPRIWLYGLRNPWRLSFDPSNGDLYVGDVGQNTWEEINYGVAGTNYRWPQCEGTCGAGTGFENPIHQYPNTSGAAITQGPVYRGGSFPASYDGAVFYGDYQQGFIRYVTVDANHQVTGDFTFEPNASGPVDIEVGPDGCLYWAAIWAGEIVQVCGSSANVLTGLGPDVAAAPRVQAWSNTGQPNATLDFSAYGTGGYGVNVGRGDIDGGGTDEILTGPGPSPSFGPQVRAFLTPTATSVGKVNFFAYGTLKFGVGPEGGDLDNDGADEIVTTPGPGAVFGPHVRGWNFDGGTLAALGKISFFAFSTLKYGARNHDGNIDGDPFAEMVVGPGPGSVFGAQVRGFNYDGAAVTSIAKVNFVAYSGLLYGTQVSVADADGDSIGEILTGPGEGPANPSNAKGWNYDGATVAMLAGFDFTAYAGAIYGVRVAGGDVDGDSLDEALTMPASPTLAPNCKGWNYESSVITPMSTLDFVADPSTRFGGNVEAGDLGF